MTRRFHEAQVAFRAALCDSFNTPEALNVLRDIVSQASVYIASRSANLEISVLERIARWVGGMLRMFGLGEGESSESSSRSSSSSVQVSDTATRERGDGCTLDARLCHGETELAEEDDTVVGDAHIWLWF